MLRPWLCWLLCLWLLTAQARERVVLFGDEAYPPYSYVENGEFKGIYVDFLKQVSTRLSNFELELRPVPWKRGLEMIRRGEQMGLFPPYQFSERGYMVPYSVPLWQESLLIACHPDVMQKPRTRFPEDFLGLHIGVNRGFLLARTLQTAARNGKIRLDEADSNEANLLKLAARRIDCYANDALSMRYTLHRLQTSPATAAVTQHLQLVETVQLGDPTAHVGFSAYFTPVYKARFMDELNAGINQLVKEGLMRQLVESYQAR
ncbi:substrate-binding periplasmic protein [Chitinibacter tainanensis]|uniref:substrate-binding periplasmic protein n=1 Tax=Chitinibacter tainanensis TaxID=230667 RepID=UPI0003FDAB83|nr:transporter substrate-binding domain-containing protein [Chitinibacter tainanensis]